MSSPLTTCLKQSLSEPPDFVLNWTSNLSWVYPWFLRVGLVIQRLMQ
jgi:hypothetical protein